MTLLNSCKDPLSCEGRMSRARLSQSTNACLSQLVVRALLALRTSRCLTSIRNQRIRRMVLITKIHNLTCRKWCLIASSVAWLLELVAAAPSMKSLLHPSFCNRMLKESVRLSEDTTHLTRRSSCMVASSKMRRLPLTSERTSSITCPM